MKKILTILSLIFLITTVSCQGEYETVYTPDLKESKAVFVEPEPDSILVNIYEVNRIVDKYAKAAGMHSGRSFGDVTYAVNDDEGTPVLYIVNKANDGGFFIISARKNATPLLAYNDNGNFDFAALQSSEHTHPMVAWVENIKNAILNEELADSVSINSWSEFEAGPIKNFNMLNSRAIDDEEFSLLQAIMMDKTVEWFSEPETKVYRFEDFWTAYPDLATYYSEVLPGGMIYLNYWEDYERLTLFVEREESTMYKRGTTNIKWNQDPDWNMSFPTYSSNGVTKNFKVPSSIVAVGQIMRSDEYPTYYNWADMPLDNGTKTASDFLYHIATKSKAKFSYYGGEEHSDVSDSILIETLHSFGYKATFSGTSRITIPSIVRSTLTNIDGKDITHSWTITAESYFVSERTLACWTFPEKGVFRDTDNIQLSFENSPVMYYANWGRGGYANCWLTNVRYAAPPDYKSGYSHHMIVDIYPDK